MAGFEAGPVNPQPLNLRGVNVRPDFDVIELLPAGAADKLRMLRQRAADAHAIIPKFEEVRLASMARVEAANTLKRLTDHPQDRGFNLKPEDKQVIAATKLLEKLTADFNRLQELQQVRAVQWQSASAALAGCEAWVRDGRPHGTALEDYEAEPVKLNKGEGILDVIERVRRRGRELKADLHRIRSAPYPSSHAKAQMRQQIDALAQQGAPSVSLLIEHDREISWATQQVQSRVHNAQPGAVAFAEVPDTVALVAWLHKDALIAALAHAIASEADDKAALSHEARQKAEAEVMGDLLAVERDEAVLVWLAMEKLLPVEHRADCDPGAILQCRLVTAPAVNGSPGTSQGFAWDIVRAGR